MSEFIAACPKCSQQILCDTAYAGKRIACPVCMQEIEMPEPARPGNQTAANPSASAPQPATNMAGGKGNGMMLAVIGGIVVLVLVAVVAVLAVRKPAAVATPAPAPTAPVGVAPAPAASAVAPARTAPAPLEVLNPCRAILAFDQDQGNTIPDLTGNGYNGKLVGEDSTWIKAANPNASGLRLSGSNYVEIAAPVVNTAQSFTVAARVRLDKMETRQNQIVATINGDVVGGFELGFFAYTSVNSPGGMFGFARAADDSKSASGAKARTKYPVTTNVWYHIAGVYDASAQTISLYLNGNLQTNVPCTSAWQATGKTIIGHGLWGGRSGSFLSGVVRDVRFYAIALTPDQIKEIAR